jgi:cytochrome c biogenesis protein CcmG, thiol:disulfide interchange protein DsbE
MAEHAEATSDLIPAPPSALDLSGHAAPSPRRVAPFIALGVAAVFAVLFVVLAGAKSGQNIETANTPLFMQPAPPINGPTLDGGTFDLSRRRGSWIVLNFFQSSCVPCIQEHPELVKFAGQQAGLVDGAELVSAVFDDEPKNLTKFFADNGGGDWPVVLEEAGVPVDYGVSKVPETWIIDPDGRIVWRTITTVTADGLSAVVQGLRDEFASRNG